MSPTSLGKGKGQSIFGDACKKYILRSECHIKIARDVLWLGGCGRAWRASAN
jgi:hypothetical protein